MDDVRQQNDLHVQSGDPLIKTDEPWFRLLNILSGAIGRKIIYVLGPNDSGKSTFCRFLIENLSGQFLTAYIDADPGQSSIGPPTTVGLKLYQKSGENKKYTFLCFVGATTPRGHLLQTLAAIKKLTEQAIRLGAQRIIIDSCGFVSDGAAREFQFQLIQLLRPDHIVVFETNADIMRWVSNFKRHPGINVHWFSVSDAVVPRTFEERKCYREDKFKKYFEGAKQQELRLHRIGFHGRVPDLKNPDYFCNRLIALCNADNYVLTLGIAQELDLVKKVFRLVSPDFNPGEVVFIYFGSIYLTEDGKQVLPGYSA